LTLAGRDKSQTIAPALRCSGEMKRSVLLVATSTKSERCSSSASALLWRSGASTSASPSANSAWTSAGRDWPSASRPATTSRMLPGVRATAGPALGHRCWAEGGPRRAGGQPPGDDIQNAARGARDGRLGVVCDSVVERAEARAVELRATRIADQREPARLSCDHPGYS